MLVGSKPLSLGASLLVHGAVLVWVASGPPPRWREKPKSLYEQTIAGNEKKIVWYHLQDKLPEVSPLERNGISRPPRAEVRTPQPIVSNPPDAPRSRQLIWQPAPRLDPQPEIRSPNLLAFRAPAPTAPPEPPPRAKPKLFIPPSETAPRPVPAAELPQAPEVHSNRDLHADLQPTISAPPKAEPRKFNAPAAPKRNPSPAPALPSPVPVQMAANLHPKLPIPLGDPAAVPARPQPRAFVAPREAARPSLPAPALPAAPAVQVASAHGPANAARLPAGIGDIAAPEKPVPRRFVPPAVSGGAPGTRAQVLESAPVVSTAPASGNLTAAIIGLNPAQKLQVPPPEGSRNARFSGGPEVRATGGTGEPIDGARIFVPGLMIAGPRQETKPTVLVARRAPTSAENLAAAARVTPTAPPPADRPAAVPVATAPDPYLAGRPVYSMAVQMPNVTSYSGSWMIWFAERESPGGVIRAVSAPVPLRKVDPKYLPSAIADGVEGKVRLAAVIRKDGRVASVAVVKPLDERLDHSAEEALSKWEFEPATRDGKPVEVDAVIEIPFRLNPRAGHP